jgi:hypothetical protein
VQCLHHAYVLLQSPRWILAKALAERIALRGSSVDGDRNRRKRLDFLPSQRIGAVVLGKEEPRHVGTNLGRTSSHPREGEERP